MSDFLRRTMKLDQKNCTILNILQKNCRTSLTNIAKETGLSIDSVKKRIQRMIKEDIFDPKIQIRPRNFGFNNIVEVKIKLQDADSVLIKEFIEYLKENKHVAEVISISGEWDFTIVIISRDALHLGRITGEIRDKFHGVIKDWVESLTTCVYKFEEYDMLKLEDDKK